MWKLLGPIDIANEVKLSRTQHTGAIILTEGTTDSRVLSRFVDKNKTLLIPSNSKKNSLGALRILENSNFTGIMSVVDSDFWKIEHYSPQSKNIILTDTHDFDMMLISSPSFDKLLSEFSNQKKTDNISKTPRDYLIDMVKPIGYLRWISSPFKNNLALKFKGLSFSHFIDHRNFRLDEDHLMNAVINNTPNCSVSFSDLKSKLISIKQHNPDPLQLCNGHDIVKALDIGLRMNFGNMRGQNVNCDIIEGTLRIGYEKEYFEKTDLYKSLQLWEQINKSYKVLQ
ncbi:MAG TPA: DUF4435 domain-containing protein [Ignavibacteriaceae bacterium]|nr:DUF4435 domain-containing protein [Ignavibacteriaceae bacterium]